MSPGLRRLLALAAVFVTAFVVVTGVRTWRSGMDLRQWIPSYFKKSEEFRPEKFSLSDKSPLAIGDVELLSRLNDEYAKLTEAVVPSVVSINTAGIRSEELFDPWRGSQVRNYPTQGQGSGVIVTSEGHVMTNHHVVEGQQKIQVTLHGGKTYGAHLIGEDTLLDIAVLKIDSNETFTPLRLGDSAQVKVGQIVLAVGNPFGLGETVTQGIISAKERSLSDNQRDLFQTDAAINPGNSGGPLVNLRGEIIGINVAIFSVDKQNPGFQGVGFSIPANDVKDSLFQILERGRPIRGYLGISKIRDVDPTVRAILGYEGESGVAMLSITPGSPAQEAGLLPGDIVQSVNGMKIRSAAQLLSQVQRAKVGEVLNMEVWRKGEVLDLKASIVESSGAAPQTTTPTDPADRGKTLDPATILQSLGIQVRDLSSFEQQRGFRGVLITGIVKNGLGAEHLQAGDLIIAVNNARIDSANEFLKDLAATAAVQSTSLQLIRGGQAINITIPAFPREP